LKNVINVKQTDFDPVKLIESKTIAHMRFFKEYIQLNKVVQTS